MVQFKDVSKIYSGNVVAVDQINLALKEGEFIFLIGPSGSGKTTLIKMLIRDEKPSAGKIFFDDNDITKLRRGKVYKLRRQVGVIFQDYKLIQDKTAYENVEFAMEAAGKKKKEIKETVPYVLDIVGLNRRMKAFPKQLSGGEQQRVAIARAIANNPRILIADEPTGNLDPASAWDIVQILNKINNWGTTVIMSTHDTDIVNAINKRVVQMDGGRVIRDDTKGQYEFKDEYESTLADQEEVESTEEESQKKIKVNITSSMQEEEEPQKKQSLFSRFLKRTSKEKKEKKNEKKLSIIDELESEGETSLESKIKDLEEAGGEEPSKKEKKNKLKKQKKNKKSAFHLDIDQNSKSKVKSKKSDKSKKNSRNKEKKVSVELLEKNYVDDLDLPKKVARDLKSAGFETVYDIVEEGPESLADKLIIDPEEVLTVAKSIEKFIKKHEK